MALAHQTKQSAHSRTSNARSAWLWANTPHKVTSHIKERVRRHCAQPGTLPADDTACLSPNARQKRGKLGLGRMQHTMLITAYATVEQGIHELARFCAELSESLRGLLNRRFDMNLVFQLGITEART